MASARKNTDRGSLATAASDQVRAIIEAAEQTAVQIRAEAEEEAARIRREAEEEAAGIRSNARGDVQALLDSIRTGMASLGADFERLQERLEPAAVPAPREPAPAPEAREPAPAPAPAAPAATPAAGEADADAPAGEDDAQIESARLVALNMALDGASREEVDRYLSENFAVADRAGLLDEVYALAGG